ncbi:MAG TPA: hypothetical protein VGY55_11770 [Pirellulales bacterium]|jgi:hypothetical protein|nr:hypothetical protein [Pirellulales bacterium]
MPEVPWIPRTLLVFTGWPFVAAGLAVHRGLDIEAIEWQGLFVSDLAELTPLACSAIGRVTRFRFGRYRDAMECFWPRPTTIFLDSYYIAEQTRILERMAANQENGTTTTILDHGEASQAVQTPAVRAGR